MREAGRLGRLAGRAARALLRASPLGDPLRAAHRWFRRPGELAGREVCLFVTHDPSGRVPEHALHHARAWAGRGWAVVVIAATDDVAGFDPSGALDFADGVLARANAGYDFGAWASAIRLLGPGLTGAARLAIVNDSVYGPLDGFGAMLDRARRSPADWVGAVESLERGPHLQSFLLFFNPGALRSRAFRRFWRGVRLGDRDWVIHAYELGLTRRLEAGGLTRDVLFPAPAGEQGNPTLTRWRELVGEGFPYVKRQLLRDDPFGADLAGWQAFVAERGFDPALAERHLAGEARHGR